MFVTFLLFVLQLVPAVKIAWEQTEGANRFNLYRAPLVTTLAVNDEGVAIPSDSCGAWRKLGNTGGLWAFNAPPSGSWCYAVTQVVDGIESDKSDVAVVEIP